MRDVREHVVDRGRELDHQEGDRQDLRPRRQHCEHGCDQGCEHGCEQGCRLSNQTPVTERRRRVREGGWEAILLGVIIEVEEHGGESRIG